LFRSELRLFTPLSTSVVSIASISEMSVSGLTGCSLGVVGVDGVDGVSVVFFVQLIVANKTHTHRTTPNIFTFIFFHPFTIAVVIVKYILLS